MMGPAHAPLPMPHFKMRGPSVRLWSERILIVLSEVLAQVRWRQACVCCSLGGGRHIKNICISEKYPPIKLHYENNALWK